MNQGTLVAFDPALLMSTDSEDPTAFWTRFSEWTADRRLFLAAHSHHSLVEWCSRVLWDSESNAIPRYLRREVTSQVNRFLSRTPVEHSEPLSVHTSHPIHVAVNGDLSPCITSDLIGIARLDSLAGLGTSSEFWSESESELTIDSLPVRIPLILKPNQQTETDLGLVVKAFYAGSRLIIVGGKKDARVISEIESACGISSSDVQWIESELNKSPRSLEAKLKGFSGLDYHLVFVYGRVGHDSFEHVQKAAAKAKYQLIQPELESRIVAELSSRALAGENPQQSTD